MGKKVKQENTKHEEDIDTGTCWLALCLIMDYHNI